MKNHMIKASVDVLLNLYNVISIKVEEATEGSGYVVNAYLTEQEHPELLYEGTSKECQGFLTGAYEATIEYQKEFKGERGPAGFNAA